MTSDDRFMQNALSLARRGLGTTAPNPSVGCVIVAHGRVVGRGWTQAGGRPHAETQALERAGPAAKGATAYVTLEPCAHHGQTGPCAQALIDAGISRVVSAMEDPDPRVSGRGHAMLRAAGVHVSQGVCSTQAQAMNAGFLNRVKAGQPWVTLKVAASLDGRTALASGVSQWITGPQARAVGHALRADHDAILTGIGTVIADDPALDCRLPGLADRSPVRFIADTHGRLPPTARVLRQPPGGKVYVLTTNAGFAAPSAEPILVPRSSSGCLDVVQMLMATAARGVTRLLVEAGPRLTTAFVQAGAADEIVWFHSGAVLGGDARAAIGPLGLDQLAHAPQYRRIALARWGDDVMETYSARP